MNSSRLSGNTGRFATALAFAFLIGACAESPEPVAQGLPPGVQAISLLGDTLRTLPLPAETRTRYEQQLAEAKAAYDRAPGNLDSIIWFGRRTAYLGHFREAIDVFSRGVAQFPNDPWLLRHRGHRYLSVREFDLAIADFERATQLVAGKPDEVEPDGQPNARNIPIGTLQSNIAYHLGLAYYLQGRYDRALVSYQNEFAIAKNEDRRASIAYWLYLSLRRLGRDAEASEVLKSFTRNTEVIENVGYLRLLLLFKGELPVDSVFAGGSTGEMSVTDATAAYGVAMWHSLNNRHAESERLLRRLIASGQWGAFGYIAAEAELARKAGSAR